MRDADNRGRLGALAAVWGILGVTAMLSWAIVRLTPIAIAAFDHDLAWHHWLALLAIVAFMLHSEGYHGFQKSFSPRVAGRAADLRERPGIVTGILAPLYCVGYFGSTTRLKIRVWGLTLGIVVMVIIVHRIDQPWRGLIDVGVVAGLAWGVVTTLVLGRRVFSRVA